MTDFIIDRKLLMMLQEEADWFASRPLLVRHETAVNNVHLPLASEPNSSSFLTFRSILEDRAFLDCSRALFGTGVAVYGADLFIKRPGNFEVPWHRDRDHWPSAPDRACTIWIPLVDVNGANGAIQYGGGFAAGKGGEPMIGRAGQLFVHSVDTPHKSGPNRSHKRRDAVAIRVAPTE